MSKKQAIKRARHRESGVASAQRTAAERLRREQAARDAAWKAHREKVTADYLAGLFSGGARGVLDLATIVDEGPQTAAPTRIRSTRGEDGSYQLKEGWLVKMDGPDKRKRRRLYLTVPELAEVLRCSYDKAHDLVDSRRLPSHRPTGEHRVPIAAIVAYLRATATEAAVPGESAAHLEAMLADHRAHIEEILDRDDDPSGPVQPAQPAGTA